MSEVNGWMVWLEYNWSWLEIGMENQFVNIAVDVGTFLLVLICLDGFEWMSFFFWESGHLTSCITVGNCHQKITENKRNSVEFTPLLVSLTLQLKQRNFLLITHNNWRRFQRDEEKKDSSRFVLVTVVIVKTQKFFRCWFSKDTENINLKNLCTTIICKFTTQKKIK